MRTIEFDPKKNIIEFNEYIFNLYTQLKKIHTIKIMSNFAVCGN